MSNFPCGLKHDIMSVKVLCIRVWSSSIVTTLVCIYMHDSIFVIYFFLYFWYLGTFNVRKLLFLFILIILLSGTSLLCWNPVISLC